jgi:hypothetical protein
MSVLGMVSQVKSARIEFENPQNAKDSLALHNSNIAGVLLTVELSTSTSSSAHTSTVNTQKTVVKLENMVKTVEEVFEEDFKEEIAEEAASHGSLQPVPVTVTIGDIDVTNDTLESFTDKHRSKLCTSSTVLVFLHYNEAASANKAQSSMNGRLFAGLTIKATLL